MSKLKNFGFKEGEMLISGWVAPPPAHSGKATFITEKVYKEIAESGLNAIYGMYDNVSVCKDEVINALKAAEKAGIKYLASDPRFLKGELDPSEYKAAVDFYHQYPAFAGINICDEPGEDKFDKLGALREKVEPLLNGKAFYINLMPMYATHVQLTNGWWTDYHSEATDANYEKHLKEYTEKVKPQFISYDFYPFMKEFGYFNPRYFEQLAMVRKYAEKLNAPFFVFIQVVSWRKKDVRNMTAPEIEWQVSTSLACGCKGIQYFTYWTPINGDTSIEDFNDAMIDSNGLKTDSYYTIKNINKHISVCGKTLINCDYKGLLAFNNSPAPLVKDLNIVKNYGAVSFETKDDMIIGCFKTGLKDCYYIVNNSLTKNVSAEFTNKNPDTFLVIRGAEIKTGNKGILNLAPAEGVLLTT